MDFPPVMRVFWFIWFLVRGIMRLQKSEKKQTDYFLAVGYFVMAGLWLLWT